MGYLEKLHGMTMVGRTPKGTCPMCAKAHAPEQPHDKGSLTYQYKFYDEHGRWPTWKDAMEHCSPDIKAFWQQALEEKGIKIGGN